MWGNQLEKKGRQKIYIQHLALSSIKGLILSKGGGQETKTLTWKTKGLIKFQNIFCRC